MDAVTKQHDRPSTEYSQLLSVGEIKVQMAGVYSRQCQEGLAGMDKRELKATMNVSDSDLADLESTCRYRSDH